MTRTFGWRSVYSNRLWRIHAHTVRFDLKNAPNIETIGGAFQEKLVNPVLMDMGPAGVKFANAIQNVLDNPNAPGLEQYANNFYNLGAALIGNSDPQLTASSVAGYLAHGQQVITNLMGGEDAWNSLSPSMQNALLVQYYNQGPQRYIDTAKAAEQNGVPYIPSIDPNGGAGANYIANEASLENALNPFSIYPPNYSFGSNVNDFQDPNLPQSPIQVASLDPFAGFDQLGTSSANPALSAFDFGTSSGVAGISISNTASTFGTDYSSFLYSNAADASMPTLMSDAANSVLGGAAAANLQDVWGLGSQSGLAASQGAQVADTTVADQAGTTTNDVVTSDLSSDPAVSGFSNTTDFSNLSFSDTSFSDASTSFDFGSFDFGIAPVVLDLTGGGIKITPLTSSNDYFDTAGDGRQHRTAWAGAGNGILVLDLAGNGQITQRNQIVFTDWDPTATSDMQALRDVFDTNGNGLLDAGDAQFASFKIPPHAIPAKQCSSYNSADAR